MQSTLPTRLTIGTHINKTFNPQYIMASIIGLVGAVIQPLDTKTFPVVPRHTLVNLKSDQDSMVKYKRLLQAPKRLISLILVFFLNAL